MNNSFDDYCRKENDKWSEILEKSVLKKKIHFLANLKYLRKNFIRQ